MTTIQSILSRLTEAVSGTDKQLFNEQELNKFATFYLDKWDENTSEDVVAESFVDYWWNTDRTCRRCSECGKLMREGYCVDMGVAYYCSKDCLHTDFTDEEWNEECENNDQSYYTLSLQKNTTQSHKLQNDQGKTMIAKDSFVPLL